MPQTRQGVRLTAPSAQRRAGAVPRLAVVKGEPLAVCKVKRRVTWSCKGRGEPCSSEPDGRTKIEHARQRQAKLFRSYEPLGDFALHTGIPAEGRPPLRRFRKTLAPGPCL